MAAYQSTFSALSKIGIGAKRNDSLRESIFCVRVQIWVTATVAAVVVTSVSTGVVAIGRWLHDGDHDDTEFSIASGLKATLTRGIAEAQTLESLRGMLSPLPLVGGHVAVREELIASRSADGFRLFVLAGPRGVGKTRLVDEAFRSHATRQWFKAYHGDCVAAPGAAACSPYGPCVRTRACVSGGTNGMVMTESNVCPHVWGLVQTA